jgi:hypothetical protein
MEDWVLQRRCGVVRRQTITAARHIAYSDKPMDFTFLTEDRSEIGHRRELRDFVRAKVLDSKRNNN